MSPVLSPIRSFVEQPVLIGYMRVSKAHGSQTLDLQRDALLAAGSRSLRSLALPLIPIPAKSATLILSSGR